MQGTSQVSRMHLQKLHKVLNKVWREPQSECKNFHKRGISVPTTKRPVKDLVVTVFGSTGFLGRYVVHRLGKLGVQVIVPYRGEEKHINHLKVMGDVGQIVPVKFAIRDVGSVERIVAKSNVVINLIGSNYDTRNFSITESNVESARTIATAAMKYGVQDLIHTSWIANPSSHSRFAQAKLEGERVVRETFPEAVILRSTHIYGEEDKLINKYGLLAYNWPTIFPLYLDGATKIQPLYVRDFASAVINSMADRACSGKTFNLGGPEIITIRDFVEDIVFKYAVVQYGQVYQIPRSIAYYCAWILEKGRNPLITRDQLLFGDCVLPTDPHSLTLSNLGIEPTHIDKVAQIHLRKFIQPGTLYKEDRVRKEKP